MQRGYDDDTLEAALARWAVSELARGGALRTKSYTAWYRAHPDPKPPSAGAMVRSLAYGRQWGHMIFARRESLAALAPDPRVPIEVPVTCTGRGGLSWIRMSAASWGAGARCECADCRQPTIAETYPQVLDLLCDRGDATLAVTRWTLWKVCTFEGSRHRPMNAPAMTIAADLASGRLRCGGCRGIDRFYSWHKPGGLAVQPRRGPRAAIEAKVLEAMRTQNPVLDVRSGLGVVMPRHSPYRGMYAITPDLVLSALRTAIELDGGTGSSPRYSRHDTEEGAIEDAKRDRRLAEVGWRTIRVRHPNALV